VPLNATEGAYRRMTAVERRRSVMEAYANWLNDERGKVLAISAFETARGFQVERISGSS
jgi:hypothetical protein